MAAFPMELNIHRKESGEIVDELFFGNVVIEVIGLTGKYEQGSEEMHHDQINDRVVIDCF